MHCCKAEEGRAALQTAPNVCASSALTAAPDLTDTSSGFSTSPNFWPLASSTVFRASRISSHKPSGRVPPARNKPSDEKCSLNGRDTTRQNAGGAHSARLLCAHPPTPNHTEPYLRRYETGNEPTRVRVERDGFRRSQKWSHEWVLTAFVVLLADLRRYREPCRHVQPDSSHLAQVGALAAELHHKTNESHRAKRPPSGACGDSIPLACAGEPQHNPLPRRACKQKED